MASLAAKRLAGAIRRGAARHDARVGPRVYRATITSLAPLGLDLHGVDLNLDDDDVDFSQEVNVYNATTGLVIGDQLALIEVEEGDWIAIGVVSDTDVS